MAEWTGRKRTLNSVLPVGYPPVDAASDHLPPPPPAPGAESSPQRPGATPDTPDLKGRPRGSEPPLGNTMRPLTEYGTAQRLLHMFTPAPGTTLTAADWEQGPSSREEQLKAYPAMLTPVRPLSGYGLGLGRSAQSIAASASEDAIEAAPAAAAIPAAVQEIVAAAATTDAAAKPAEVAPAQAVPAGAVAGNGTAECPADYPVKGNAESMLYHTTASHSYGRTIPEFCFASTEAAAAAGFRAAGDK